MYVEMKIADSLLCPLQLVLQYRDSAKAEKAIDLAHYYLDPLKISEGIIWWLSIPLSGKFVLKGLDVRQKWPFSMFPFLFFILAANGRFT